MRTTDHLVAALVALAVFRLPGPLPEDDLYLVVALAVAGIVAFPLGMAAFGLYRSQRRESLGRMVGRLGLAGALVAAMLVGTAFALGKPDWSPAAASLAFSQTAVFAVERVALHWCLRLFRRRGRNFRRIVVVGTGPRARAFVDEVAAHPAWGLQLAAFVDDSDVAHDPALGGERVWKLVDFPGLARSQVIDDVVIAVPRSMLTLMEPVIAECARLGVPVSVLSEFFSDMLPTVRAERYGRFPVLRFAAVDHSRAALGAKRALDTAGALLALVIFAPVLAVACLAIRLSSPGPVLYRQIRLGRNGRPFEFLKLRSMVVGADALKAELLARNEMNGPVFKIRDDPRITRIGRSLRRWSLDELPQFWNVLRGDMSLVGPRPPLPDEVDQYQSRDRRRISVRPGITCLWQIGGRTRIQFADWVELDLHYIDHWSLWLDLWILLRTPLAVIRREGAS